MTEIQEEAIAQVPTLRHIESIRSCIRSFTKNLRGRCLNRLRREVSGTGLSAASRSGGDDASRVSENERHPRVENLGLTLISNRAGTTKNCGRSFHIFLPSGNAISIATTAGPTTTRSRA